MRELPTGAAEVIERLPPDLWWRLLRHLEAAETAPRGTGKKLIVEIGLTENGKATSLGTCIWAPKEYVEKRAVS